MKRHLDVVAGAGLLIVATVLVFIPELRTTPMRLAGGVLWLIVGGSTMWRDWKAGILKLTPAQIYALRTRPRVSLLTLVAMAMAAVALMVAGH